MARDIMSVPMTDEEYDAKERAIAEANSVRMDHAHALAAKLAQLIFPTPEDAKDTTALVTKIEKIFSELGSTQHLNITINNRIGDSDGAESPWLRGQVHIDHSQISPPNFLTALLIEEINNFSSKADIFVEVFPTLTSTINEILTVNENLKVYTGIVTDAVTSDVDDLTEEAEEEIDELYTVEALANDVEQYGQHLASLLRSKPA